MQVETSKAKSKKRKRKTKKELLREKLVLERDKRLIALGQPLPRNEMHSSDDLDRCQVTIETNMSVSTRQRKQQELAEIRIAIQMLEEGEYGYCQDCEDKISQKRLKTRPWATRCIECQCEHEKTAGWQ